MNVMFLTIDNYRDFNIRSIYMDLINELRARGHYVTVISACEKRDQSGDNNVNCASDEYGEIKKIYVPNVTKMSNFVMKGINLLRLMPAYKKAAMDAMQARVYQLVLYGSPPITVYGAVRAVKRKQNAFSYLMLKDIWPYDCLFGGALSLYGIKRIAFNYLAFLARRLYNCSDKIGCMSPANIRFLIEHEPYLDSMNKIEICPNCIKPVQIDFTYEQKKFIRNKYGIPDNKVIFVYGGNLGIPQGIDFVISSIKASQIISDAFFLIIGGGTEINKLEQLTCNQNNFKLLNYLPKEEYDMLVATCDVGLVYLNSECLAPNFPSRILTYMQARLPVLCATDTYTDVGSIAQMNGFGFLCESRETKEFVEAVEKFCNSELREKMGEQAYKFLIENYSAEKVCDIVLKHFRD